MSEIDFVVLMSKWSPFRTAGSRGAAFSMLLDFRLAKRLQQQSICAGTGAGIEEYDKD
jgi:hypothetical protein